MFEALITEQGLDGDRQRDLRHHGGPDRAVSLFATELIRRLKAEGHPIAAGTAGENLTVSGIDWTLLRPGCTLEIGPARLCITSYASPCETIECSFLKGEVRRISQKAHPGWSRLYARVLEGGLVTVGDGVRLVIA